MSRPGATPLALHCLSKPSGVHMTSAMDSMCQKYWTVYRCDMGEPCLDLLPKEAEPARLQNCLCMCSFYKGCAAPVGWQQTREEHFSQGYHSLIHRAIKPQGCVDIHTQLVASFCPFNRDHLTVTFPIRCQQPHSGQWYAPQDMLPLPSQLSMPLFLYPV